MRSCVLPNFRLLQSILCVQKVGWLCALHLTRLWPVRNV